MPNCLIRFFPFFCLSRSLFFRVTSPPYNFCVTSFLNEATVSLARETVASFRKDVTQKLYGGDVTRKNKLLDKQKKGKKRMRQFGKVDIPQNAFLNALKMNEN